MGYSSLVSYVCVSPNKTAGRNHKVDRISIHCMAGNLTVESCGQMFQSIARQASSNYGIGSDGRIACYVDEINRSWCTSSSLNDHRAITIEVANTQARYPWPVSDEAYNSLIELLVDICKRYNKKKLIWFGDKTKTLNYTPADDEMVMTVHRWFAAKECPGETLYNLHPKIAETVTNRLNNSEDGIDMTKSEFIKSLSSDEALEIYNLACKSLQDNDCSTYSKEAREWAIKEGIIAGNGGTPPNYMWQAPMTREQFVTVLHRFFEMMTEG